MNYDKKINAKENTVLILDTNIIDGTIICSGMTVALYEITAVDNVHGRYTMYEVNSSTRTVYKDKELAFQFYKSEIERLETAFISLVNKTSEACNTQMGRILIENAICSPIMAQEGLYPTAKLGTGVEQEEPSRW